MALGNVTKITLTEDNIASVLLRGKSPSQLTIPDCFNFSQERSKINWTEAKLSQKV